MKYHVHPVRPAGGPRPRSLEDGGRTVIAHQTASRCLALLLGLCIALAARAGTPEDDVARLLQQNRMSLVKAITAAESHSSGKAIAAAVRVEGQSGQVLVHCVVNDKCTIVPVDVRTGKAGKPTDPTPAEEKEAHTGRPKDIVKALTDEQASLPRAIEAAERSHGQAVAVACRFEGGSLSFVVTCVADGKTRRVTVDPKGSITRVDEPKRSEPDRPPPKGPRPGKP